MGSSSNLLRVRGKAEFAQLKKELGGVRGEFDKLGNSKGAKSILQGVGMGAGISAWNALGSAVGMATDFIGDSIKAASDQREAMALTAQVFGQNTKAIDEWSRNAKDAFSTTEALTFASTFGTAFKSVGLQLDDVTEKSKAMVKLAGDLGSAFNTSSQEAATALRSGLIGESEPMRRFGVFLSEAAVNAKAAQMGIAELGTKLTDAQKVTARYALIMEQTADSHGMFGRDTESLADATKLLESQIADLQAEMGQEMLVVVKDVTQALVDLTPAIKAAIEAWKGWRDVTKDSPLQSVPDLMVNLGDEVGKVVKHFQDMFAATTDETTALIAFREAERGTLTATGLLAETTDNATQSAEALAAANKEAAAMFKAVRDRAKQAGDRLRDIVDAADDARDALLGTAKQPKELKLELEGARLEGQDLKDKLRELEGKKPTREVRQDIIDTKLAIIDNQKKVIGLEGDLVRLGQVSLSDHEQTIERLGFAWGDAKDEVDAYLRSLSRVPGVKVPSRAGANNRGAFTTEAMGGYVEPGRTYTVGEAGMETLVMGAGGGGYVLPNGRGGGSSGGSGSPVVVQLNLDGREVARVVDKHLYYEAARAPRSSYAG